jgi:hypothetical protein
MLQHYKYNINGKDMYCARTSEHYFYNSKEERAQLSIITFIGKLTMATIMGLSESHSESDIDTGAHKQ